MQQRHDVHRHGAQQHPALAEPVDQPRDDRRGAGVDECEGRRQRAGPAVAVGLGDDEQHDAETDHRDRHPGDERRGREAQPAGCHEQIAVGPEHGRTVRDEGDGPPPRTACEDQPVSVTESRTVDTSPYDALLLRLLRRAGGPGRRAAVPRERHPRPGDPARTPARGRRALPRLRRGQPDQRAEPRARRGACRPTSRRTAWTCPSTGATATGRRTSPTTLARMRRRRRTPGARPAHLGLLVLLRLPAVPREPRGRRRAARRPRPAGRPDPALLQPPRVRRGDGGEHGRGARASCRPTSGAGARLVFVTHSMPDVDGRDERPGRRRVQPAAPRRGTAGHRRRRGRDRHRPRARPRLLQPQRPAAPSPGSSRTSTTTSSRSPPTASRRPSWCRSASSPTTWR